MLERIGIFANDVYDAPVDFRKIIAFVVNEFRLVRERFHGLIFVVQLVEFAVFVQHVHAARSALVCALGYFARKFRSVNRAYNIHLFAFLNVYARFDCRRGEVFDKFFVHDILSPIFPLFIFCILYDF